jgi:hypothetical protein
MSEYFINRIKKRFPSLRMTKYIVGIENKFYAYDDELSISFVGKWLSSSVSEFYRKIPKYKSEFFYFPSSTSSWIV